jgi:hypothetical protein
MGNGRYELPAETIAINGEAAPTAAQSFVLTGSPRTCSEADFIRYSIEAQKEMV